MAQEKDTLLGVLRQAGLEGDVDFLRQGLQALMEALMELEVEERVGAGRYQRSPARRNWRNGWRRRGLSRRVGELLLSIPKLRRGSYFPSFLEPRRRAERALLSVVQEAYVLGVSSRKRERLLSALGLEGVSKSRVSRLCAALDRQVEGWRQRPLSGSYPYLWLDATYLKVREGERVLSQAPVLALGVREAGQGLSDRPGFHPQVDDDAVRHLARQLQRPRPLRHQIDGHRPPATAQLQPPASVLGLSLGQQRAHRST